MFAVDTTDPALESFQLVDLSKMLQSQKAISLQEQLRRERMRLFTTGVASYEWMGGVMMIPLGGTVLLFDPSKKDEPLRSVYDGSAGASVDPHLSPDCANVAFVMDDDLYVLSTAEEGGPGAGATPVRLTTNGAQPGVTCGLADFIAQEEMDRYRGFWWSPSSKMLAYTETDETHISEYHILHQGKADPRHSESHRYPFAGQPNPRVRLAVLSLPTPGDQTAGEAKESVWMDVADGVDMDPADYYIGRVGWWPDDTVMCQVQNRRQTVLQLQRLDPKTGQRTVLVEERTSVWVNLHDILHMFPLSVEGDFRFLWASERSGYCQLYLYSFSAATQTCTLLLGGRPVGGGGEWCVESIEAVDEASEMVYFSGNMGRPTEKHVLSASYAERHYEGAVLDPAAATVAVTSTQGWHACSVSPARKLVADVFSSAESLPRATLYSLAAGGGLAPLKEFVDPLRSNPDFFILPDAAAASLSKSLQTPQIMSVPSTDGKVTLYCALYRPDPALHGPGPYPTIVSVYGGPHVQRVTDSWSMTSDLRAQRLAQDGCLVIKCDNRGSSRRGLHFEGAVKWCMGSVEIEDQQAAVHHFVALGLADPARVGMFGWSYGGYMSAMSLCRAPETFCCSVAGAPVTSWDGYDTHYTERYMGLPQENAAGYEASSVMSHVEGLAGHLLLVHGLIDENVHFRHTARLINALTERRKQYDLILFPCERHSPHKVADRSVLASPGSPSRLSPANLSPSLFTLAGSTSRTASCASSRPPSRRSLPKRPPSARRQYSRSCPPPPAPPAPPRPPRRNYE